MGHNLWNFFLARVLQFDALLINRPLRFRLKRHFQDIMLTLQTLFIAD